MFKQYNALSLRWPMQIQVQAPAQWEIPLIFNLFNISGILIRKFQSTLQTKALLSGASKITQQLLGNLLGS